MRVLAVLLGVVVSAASASPQDFWSHWGDGKAELSGYRLTQPRDGEKRKGTAVLVYETEEMSDSLRVKAEPGKHPKSDLSPVMKLNAMREFRTGICDYNVMTSTFARVSPGWPVAKVSFSSQEWFGHLYHQLLPREGRVAGLFHSYFDGEVDGKDDLLFPKDGVLEDVLPILLRGWGMFYLKPGERRSVPYLPSLLTARLDHRPLEWGKAVITRVEDNASVTVPAGKFSVTTWTVAQDDGRTLSFEFESEAPYRLVRWSVGTGEEAVLLGSARLAYAKLKANGNESYLKQLGLGGASEASPPKAPAKTRAR